MVPGALSPRRWTAFVVAPAVGASFVLTLVDGPLLHRLLLPVLESSGILALQLVTVASFASLTVVLVVRWAILPSWLFSDFRWVKPNLMARFETDEHRRSHEVSTVDRSTTERDPVRAPTRSAR